MDFFIILVFFLYIEGKYIIFAAVPPSVWADVNVISELWKAQNTITKL